MLATSRITGDSAVALTSGSASGSSVIGMVERSDRSCKKTASGVPAVWIRGNGSANRFATSISAQGAAELILGLAGVLSGEAATAGLGLAAAFASGSSAAPPISRSNFASGSLAGGAF